MTTALKKFFPFWLFIFLFKIGGGLYYTVLSALGERVLPVWIVGLLIGGASVAQFICDVPAGFLIDRVGHGRMLRLTSFFLAVGGLMLLFGLHIWTFVAMVVFSAAGWLFFEPGINAYLLSYAPKAYAGRYIGLREISSSTGLLLASVSVPFALQLSPPRLGILIAGLLAFAVLAASFLRVKRQTPRQEEKIEAQHYYIRRHYLYHVMKAVRQLNPASTMLALANFSGAVFYGVIWFTVPLVIAHQVEQGGALSLGLSVLDFASVIAGGLFGRLVDRSDKKSLIFIGLLVFALMGMALGLTFGI